MALAAVVESDFLVGAQVAEAQAPVAGQRPTLHLAESLARELFGVKLYPERWLAENAVLEGIVELVGDGPLPTRELTLDPRLWAAVTLGEPRWPGCEWVRERGPALLPHSLRANLPALIELLRASERTLVVRGTPRSGSERLAAAVARGLGLSPLLVDAARWQEFPAIAAACRAAGWMPVVVARIGAGETLSLPVRRIPHVVLVGTDGAIEGPDALEIEMPMPSYAERLAWWTEALGDVTLAIEAASSAVLSGAAIVATAELAQAIAAQTQSPIGVEHVARARRQLGADQLRLMAHPVERSVAREALVLPGSVQEEIDRFVTRCRQRDRLWEGLGTTLAATVGRGARALFVGDSGTGKTLAASYVATALGAPLYRVDLAAVMNKYVGESEKNLGRLLDLAAAHDAVLLFDEADALFSQRVESGETGERYVNMLTNFLLTRFENHPGIVVLTANSRNRIDQAFVRRLDAIIEFPLPGQSERLALWQSHLGARAPSDDVLRHLAAYADLPGGNIRNAVIAAAAASPGTSPISGRALVDALAREYRKLGRPLPAGLQGRA